MHRPARAEGDTLDDAHRKRTPQNPKALEPEHLQLKRRAGGR